MRAAAVLILSVVWPLIASAQQSGPPATPPEPAPEVTPAEPAQEVPPAEPEVPPAEPPPLPEPVVTPEPVIPAEPIEAPSEPPTAPQEKRRVRLHELCHQGPGQGQFLDDTRRMLEETFCGATLWLDGLFGGEPDLANARAVSGRIELSSLHTDFEGLTASGRLRLRYDLPNLERRVNLFLGRDDRDEFVEDRREGLAIRSSVFGLETQEKWLAGLGYNPPGRWASRVDFRVGARVKTSPEVFAQTRYRRNVFHGNRNVWRFRETIFWENEEGFGFTSSVDFDRVVRRDLLFRWGSVVTLSESTEGMAWRSAILGYRNLRGLRAVAGELFLRGSTEAAIKLNEYGTRAIYRQPLGTPHLFGELIVGYTWPRFERDLPREGSAMVGLGLELLFGREPY